MEIQRKTTVYLGYHRLSGGWEAHFRLALDAGYIQAALESDEEVRLNPLTEDKDILLEVVPRLSEHELEKFNVELMKLFDGKIMEEHWLAKSFNGDSMPIAPWYADSYASNWIEHAVKYSKPIPAGRIFVLENYNDDSKNLGSWKILD